MNKTNNMRIIGRKYTTKGSIIKYEMQISLELGCVLKLVLEYSLYVNGLEVRKH
jgi:hypothetical protein